VKLPLAYLPAEERHALFSARQKRAAATRRARYGIEWDQEAARRNLAGKSPGFAAAEKKYGPDWRSFVGALGGEAFVEKHGRPRNKGHTWFQKGNQIWEKSPRAGFKFTPEERFIGRLRALVRREAGGVSVTLVEAVLAAVSKRYVKSFENVWNDVRADYAETISDRSISRALALLVRWWYVERVYDADDGNGYRRLK